MQKKFKTLYTARRGTKNSELLIFLLRNNKKFFIPEDFLGARSLGELFQLKIGSRFFYGASIERILYEMEQKGLLMKIHYGHNKRNVQYKMFNRVKVLISKKTIKFGFYE